MKKTFLSLIGFVSMLFSSQQVQTDQLTQEFLSKNIPIVDIRTAPEWKQTGIVKNSILLTFFKENGSYDAQAFLDEIAKHFSKNDTFALLCRSGNRTTMVSKFLKKQGYENVINLKGGINLAPKNNIQLVKVK